MQRLTAVAARVRGALGQGEEGKGEVEGAGERITSQEGEGGRRRRTVTPSPTFE